MALTRPARSPRRPRCVEESHWARRRDRRTRRRQTARQRDHVSRSISPMIHDDAGILHLRLRPCSDRCGVTERASVRSCSLARARARARHAFVCVDRLRATSKTCVVISRERAICIRTCFNRPGRTISRARTREHRVRVDSRAWAWVKLSLNSRQPLLSPRRRPPHRRRRRREARDRFVTICIVDTPVYLCPRR